jgi:hypothetical protein
MSSHPKTPPTLPTVVDEAGETPGWVPALGIGLFALVALLIAVQLASHDAEKAPQPPAAVAEAPAQ